MRPYLDFLRHIRDTGTDKQDRTGTGTRSVFGYDPHPGIKAPVAV